MSEMHSKYGYSAVSTFEQCPFRYYAQYVDNVKMLPDGDPANALIIGSAMHMGIEKDVDTAVKWYFEQYPIITDLHVHEEMKLRALIPKVKALLPDDVIHEFRIVDKYFIGTADLLVPNEHGFMLYDFKYSNNVVNYMNSSQLHLYKYYFEKTTGQKVTSLGYIFIPKIQIRQKKTESLIQFRQRLMDELKEARPTIKFIDYDPNKVIEHLEMCQMINNTTEFKKHETRLCNWCQYKPVCLERGKEFEMLPSINRVDVDTNNHKKIWIYGAPFSGKTFCADTAPTPLNLNTDGNVKYVTMPRLSIKDTLEGRQTVPAWEVFTSAVDDLEAGSDFETIVVDLLEDVYDYARMYICDKRGWEHESDDSFKAYEICRNEFLRTMRRLLNLPYNIILISHEDTSKDITKRGGDKTTAIKPNIADKVATKLAGMVDIVLRAEKDGDEYTLSTKTNSVIFGGGRLTGLKANDIPNTWDAIEAMYNSVGHGEKVTKKAESVPVAEPVDTVPWEEPVETPPAPRSRRSRKARNEQ